MYSGAILVLLMLGVQNVCVYTYPDCLYVVVVVKCSPSFRHVDPGICYVVRTYNQKYISGMLYNVVHTLLRDAHGIVDSLNSCTSLAEQQTDTAV